MKLIATALLKAQKQMGTAKKDAKNPFFKSNYADLNSIREACMPSLNDNGIVVLQPTAFIDGKNFINIIHFSLLKAMKYIYLPLKVFLVLETSLKLNKGRFSMAKVVYSQF